MENIDEPCVSTFAEDVSTQEVERSIKDIMSLSDVLSDFKGQGLFQSATETLLTLRIIKLIHENALQLNDSINGIQIIYTEYQRRYINTTPLTKEEVNRVIKVFISHRWMSRDKQIIRLENLGERMLAALIDLAKDSLHYDKSIEDTDTSEASLIDTDKVRDFIIRMFDPPVDSDIPNCHQLFSILAQGKYPDEAVDGLWVPVKFASPLSAETIDEAVGYIDTYEPYLSPMEIMDREFAYFSDEVAANTLVTKEVVQTENLESHLQVYDVSSMESVIVKGTSLEWSDAIDTISAISALVGNKKITIKEETQVKEIIPNRKDWEWMDNEDGSDIIQKRDERSKC